MSRRIRSTEYDEGLPKAYGEALESALQTLANGFSGLIDEIRQEIPERRWFGDADYVIEHIGEFVFFDSPSCSFFALLYKGPDYVERPRATILRVVVFDTNKQSKINRARKDIKKLIQGERQDIQHHVFEGARYSLSVKQYTGDSDWLSCGTNDWRVNSTLWYSLRMCLREARGEFE
jgi:hypothetical protein